MRHLLVSLCTLALGSALASAQTRSNVLLVMVDDLGPEYVRCYQPGSPSVATPVMGSAFPQVIVATNTPAPFARFGVETVADVFPGRGPLAGLHADMLASRHEHVFLVACDMPSLDPEVIRFLLGRIGDADAVVPCWDGDIEPLHAVYASRLLPLVERCLADGRTAMREFLPLARVDYVPEDELRCGATATASFTNVNTPEELAAVGGRFDES